METVLQKLKEWIENREEKIRTVVGGDFNARIGWEGGGVEKEEEEAKDKEKWKRHSKD